MAAAKVSRKQQFKAALALAGKSAGEWAAEQGITPQWLSLVLNGKESSLTLTGKIDAFIKEQFNRPRDLAA